MEEEKTVGQILGPDAEDKEFTYGGCRGRVAEVVEDGFVVDEKPIGSKGKSLRTFLPKDMKPLSLFELIKENKKVKKS